MSRPISQSTSPWRARSRQALILLVALTAAVVALAVTATPRLDIALEKQYELAAERPYDASVQNDLGNLLVLAGREEAAIQAYQRALELDGSHVRSRFNLGLLEQQNGRHGEALEQFEVLLEIEPEHAWAHYQSGVSLQELDRRKDAVDQYARAFGLDPTLSFAENNPHIIDNTMVTEALLLSTQYSKTASRTVARQYDDADRIVSLMLEPEVTVEESMDETVESDESRPVERATSSSGARLESEPSSETLGESEDEGNVAKSNSRVITEEDLDAGVRIGGAVGDTTTDPRSADPRSQPPRARGIDVRSARPRDLGTPRNLGGQRYRPSRRSSASLDLKLLPEEDVARDEVG